MKRSIRAVLATSAALALTGLGVAPASASEKHHPAPYEKVHDRYSFPAGTACKDTIKVNEKYKYRITVLKESAKRAYLKEEIEDGWAKFYNPKTHKSVKIRMDDTAFIKENRVNASARVKIRGEGYGQGPGVYGIVYYKGKVNLRVTNLSDPSKLEFEVRSIHGKQRQLCYALGSKPVVGKLVLPPSAQQP